MQPQKTLIYGIHSVESLLKTNPARISRLLIYQDRHDPKIQNIIELAKKLNRTLIPTTRQELDRLSHQENHQGVIAECVPIKTYHENDLENLLNNQPKPLLLILDGIQDPHNLGACLRSADAAGVTAILAPKDKSVGLTPAVYKVASGAAETVPFIQVTNLARTLRYLKEWGVWIFGAAADSEKTLYEVDLTGSLALVLGAEGTGLRRLTREHCDLLINIPMQGTVSSLNVSVAAGVCLFEAVRQRLRIS